MTKTIDTLELDVYKLLKSLKVNPAAKGYSYLKAGIIMMFEDESCRERITKTFYPAIAKKFGTTSGCVERNIRSVSTRIFNDDENKDLVKDIFGTTRFVPNSMFLACLYEYLLHNN